ncbi:MAG: CoA transferase [Chloroflexota bacterium]
MSGKLPLDGVVVVDFSWALAGPWLTKNLAEHGAKVIKIETMTHLDHNRRSPPYKDGIPGVNRSAYWTYNNNDKFDITLNLKRPRGIEIARQLVSKADVVAENFAPGIMKRFGLNYDELVKIKPDIVMVSLSMQGQTGPHSRYVGYGWLLQGISGLQSLAGFPDKPPLAAPGPQISDYVGAYSAIMAVMAALHHRQKTGQGQYIDLSQFESAVCMLDPWLLDYTVNGREARAMASRHPSASPHGVFRCKGDDRWCAIGIFTERDWETFTGIASADARLGDPRFASVEGRKEHEDELEKLVDAWSINLTAEQVMALLQAKGLAAGVVQNARDLFADPQLKWRGHYQMLEHVEVGPQVYEAAGFKLSRTPSRLRRPAPLLGQDNEYIYKEFLGMSEQEYVDALLSGTFE